MMSQDSQHLPEGVPHHSYNEDANATRQHYVDPDTGEIIDVPGKIDDLQDKLDELDNKIDSFVDTDDNVNAKQVESVVSVDSDGDIVDNDVKEYRGLSSDDKPTEGVPRYSTFIEMDTGDVYYFDDTDWQVFE